MAQSYVRVPPDSSGKLIDTWSTGGTGQQRQSVVIADPNTDANVVAIGSDQKVPVKLEQQLDLDTSTTNTVSVSVVAIGLPASGGPVAGGTATNPLNVTGVITSGTLGNVNVTTCALPSHASTDTLQTTINTSVVAQTAVLQTTGIVVASITPSLATTTNQLNTQGSPSGGTAATKSDLVGAIYNSSAPTLTNGQQASLQLDSSGFLKVNISAGAGGGTSSVDKAAFTSSTTSGTPVMGAYETSPTTIGASTAVGVVGMSVTRQLLVSAQVTTSALPSNAAIETGGNLASLAAVITTTSTTSRFAISPIVGQVGLVGNSGTITASTQRVTIATDDVVSSNLVTLGGSVSSSRMQTNPISGQAGIAGGAGTTAPNVVRVSLATDTAAITSVIPGTGATNQGKAEDAQHTSGDTGIMMLGIRQDTQTTLTSTTGDYEGLHIDQNGGVYVRPSNGVVVSERISTTIGTSTAFSNFSAVASQRNFVTAVTAFRTDTGTAMEYVDLRDGTNGTVLWTMPLPPSGGSSSGGGNQPLFRGTANTALAYDVSNNLSSVIISMSGFQSFQ